MESFISCFAVTVKAGILYKYGNHIEVITEKQKEEIENILCDKSHIDNKNK